MLFLNKQQQQNGGSGQHPCFHHSFSYFPGPKPTALMVTSISYSYNSHIPPATSRRTKCGGHRPAMGATRSTPSPLRPIVTSPRCCRPWNGKCGASRPHPPFLFGTTAVSPPVSRQVAPVLSTTRTQHPPQSGPYAAITRHLRVAWPKNPILNTNPAYQKANVPSVAVTQQPNEQTAQQAPTPKSNPNAVPYVAVSQQQPPLNPKSNPKPHHSNPSSKHPTIRVLPLSLLREDKSRHGSASVFTELFFPYGCSSQPPDKT